MKKRIALLSVFFLFSFSKTDDPQLKLKVVKIQPLGADECNVSLELHNDYGQKINYLSMYCGNDGFYHTDNPEVKVIPRNCDKNFPITKTLSKNTYHTIDLNLKMGKDMKEPRFRIGFRFIDVPKGIDLVHYDTTKVKSVTIWSNAIEFKSK